jgi:3-oxoacyl-[acyl-carrier-protein] synthase-3
VNPPDPHPARYAHITGWGAYAPPVVLTNADLEGIVETSDEWIVTRTGIRERRIAGPGETTASMAAVAARRAIAVADLDPEAIDLILVATLTPDFWMPSTAALVKEAIGNTRAAAMDLSAACSGFVYAFAMAQAQVVSGLANHVLVVGAELLSRYVDYADRSTCVLFGDGAGAVVVSASPERGGGLGLELTTDPSGAYMIWLPAGGSACPPSPRSVEERWHYIRMEGRETYRFATKTLVSTALTAIERSGIGLDDVDLLVPHQANIRIIDTVAKALGLPAERVFTNIERYGNTSAASVPIALAEAVEAGRVRVGDHLVFVAFGAGFTSGAVVVQWTADPARHGRAALVDPGAVVIRRPPGWDPGDRIPAALAPIVARQLGATTVAGLAEREGSSGSPAGALRAMPTEVADLAGREGSSGAPAERPRQMPSEVSDLADPEAVRAAVGTDR